MSIYLINASANHIPLEDESVQMSVLSPPYWGLRKYKTSHPEELGTEDLHDCKGWATGKLCGKCYICRTLAYTGEIKRVLRKDGLFFLNLGDSYNGSGGSGGDYNKGGLREGQPGYSGRNVKSLKRKDLAGVPWTVALALRDYQGWWLRNELIWWKRNAYPEGGAIDRFGRDHEQIFVFSKSSKYYFDKLATFRPYEKPLNRWGGDKKSTTDVLTDMPHESAHRERNIRPNVEGKGQRTVIDIPTSGVSGSHFAKFPVDLPILCIEAGSSEYGACSKCGAPYKRVVERSFTGEFNDDEAKKQRKRMEGVISGGVDKVTLGRTEQVHNTTVGWEPTCDCCQICDTYNELHSDRGCNPYPVVPCTIMDCFVGSGTTLLAARELGRNGIGIDLSYEYLTTDAFDRLGISTENQWKLGMKVSHNEKIKTMFDLKQRSENG